MLSKAGFGWQIVAKLKREAMEILQEQPHAQGSPCLVESLLYSSLALLSRLARSSFSI